MSLLYILGSWTIFLLSALYYLGFLGSGNKVLNESTSAKDSPKLEDNETAEKLKKKYAKKKRKRKRRQEKKQSAVVTNEQISINQEEKPESVPETNENKEKFQAPKAPVKQTRKPPVKEKKTIPHNINETKAIPYDTQKTKAIPFYQHASSIDVSPVDVTHVASHSTIYDFKQTIPNFQANEAPAPLVNDTRAPAPLVSDVHTPASVDTSDTYVPATTPKANNAQGSALLVNDARAPAPLASDVHTPASLDTSDTYVPTTTPKVTEPQVTEPDEKELQETESDDEAPIEELGGNWFAYKSTEYGLPYYHNVRTLETVWDRPFIEPQVDSGSEEPDSSQLDQKLNSPVQTGSPTLQQHVPTLQQQQGFYMGQATSSPPRRSQSRPTTFAEKLKLAKQRSPAAVPRLIVKTKQKKAVVAGIPPPLYTPMQMPQTTDTSSWATVSATPAPKKLITTTSQWVKVGTTVPAEPVAAKKKGPPTIAEQKQAFKTALMQARVAKKWKQHELAKKLDIRPQELSKYEQGKDVPSPVMINKMTRLLGVKLPRVKKTKMKETQPLPDD